ncbi:MAG: hypothetical protein AB7F51_14020 [Pseudorhodoplanes sp.]
MNIHTKAAQDKVSAARLKIPPSYYAKWLAKEGVPVIDGVMVEDVRGDLPLAHWPRKGVKGVFLNLIGGDESMAAYIIEIPPGGQTEQERCMFEEEYVVLSGRGASTITMANGKKQTFEWGPGSLFSPPINSLRQHFNGSPSETVRLLVVTNMPIIMNMFRSTDFIFNCNYAFVDRFNGEEDYFSAKGKALPNLIWRSNFIPDINKFTLQDYSWRGAGGSGAFFDMADNTIQSHLAQFPVGTYKMAHRHGPGAHILILSGTGFSLMWEEGMPMQQLDWKVGSFFAPPDMWWHQHFNSGTEPARYFAVHFGYWRVVMKDLGPEEIQKDTGVEIPYEEEDPQVLQLFIDNMAKNGGKPQPLETWRKSVPKS